MIHWHSETEVRVSGMYLLKHSYEILNVQKAGHDGLMPNADQKMYGIDNNDHYLNMDQCRSMLINA